MAAAGIRNRESYLRKMCLDGYVIRLDLSDVKDMTRLLANATNNLNQIAKRANETRNIYESDIKNIQEHYGLLWGKVNEIMCKLAEI